MTTSDFHDIEIECQLLDNSSLVLFDVDATLIVPDDAILKPNGKELFKKLVAVCTERDLFREIRMKAHHSLVDIRSILFIQNLQKQKIPVIAFTAAPSKVRGSIDPGQWRVDELAQYGFDFSSAFPVDFLELPKRPDQNHFPLFKCGVLYSSFHPKGEILIEFLNKLNLRPNKIIFVDDEFEHVQSVISFLEKVGISCLGIYYTAANELPCNVNSELAQFQVSYFIQYDEWLSDKEAKNIMEQRSN